MNAEIHNAFINALMADASYVDGLVSDPDTARRIDALKGRLTEPLAAYFAQRFEIVTQYTENNLLGTGFSATVWRELGSQQLYISFRGTEGFQDFVTDIDLAVGSGLAGGQVVAMVNWFLRASAPEGQQVLQIAPVGEGFQATTGQATGELSGLGSASLIVNGHSLGGHLTTAFARLFPDVVAASHTFNGAGFILQSEPVFQALEAVLGLPVGEFPGPTRQTNYFAEHGINITTNDWWFSQFGRRVGLFNEEGVGIPNHLLYKLSDALALYDVAAAIDNSVSFEQLNAIANASSNNPRPSLEKMLDGLRGIFLNGSGATLIGDDGGNHKSGYQPASRIDYHTKLAQLRGAVGTATGFRLESLVGKSFSELATLANDYVAHRYALKALNSFAILEADYSQHNANGELDLFDAATGEGRLTTQYLEDRAKMLAWKMERNASDIEGMLPYGGEIKAEFSDVGSKETILLGAARQRQRIVFGADHRGDTLWGQGFDDHLYGGEGNDTLLGQGGNDYLEGGKGHDTLNGGAGNDHYVYLGGEGADIVIDSDGEGTISYAGQNVSGTKNRVGVDPYTYGDALFTYQYLGAEGAPGLLVITKISDPSGSVTVQNFKSGDLGIELSSEPLPAASIDRVMIGDLAPADSDPVQPDVQIAVDELGNVIVDPNRPEANRNDSFRDSAGADHIEAKGGDDQVRAERGGADWFEMGAGNDTVDAGDGDDLIEGGSGADLLAGDAGEDRIYAERETDLEQAIADAELEAGSGAKGDWLDGGRGRDTLVGDTGNDALTGGGEEDILIAGAGDDHVMGDEQREVIYYDWTITREIEERPDSVIEYRRLYDRAYVSISAEGAGDVIYGGAGSDWLFGQLGDDLIDGGADDDVIFGQEGNDYLTGAAGADHLSGDSIDDGPNGGIAGALHGSDTLEGGAGADHLHGNGAADSLFGGEGADRISGDDIITPGQYHGDDYLEGGAGPDLLWGDGKNDTLLGGEGADHLEGDDSILAGEYHGHDVLDGGAGDDTLIGQGGGDILYGGDDNDTLEGDLDSLAIEFHGADYLNGEAGNDQLAGGAGNDQLFGGDGADLLAGEEGADALFGEAGADELQGGAGDDSLSGGNERDTLFGDDGNDGLLGDSGDDLLFGGVGDDSLSGGMGADYLDGDDGADTLTGGGENDFILGAAGDDQLAGEDGDDRLQAGAGLDLLSGGIGTDLLFGESGDDTLDGGAGDDDLQGGDGNDTLTGGAGADLLAGGSGDDVYLFSAADGIDQLTDTPGANRIRFGAGISPDTVTLSVAPGVAGSQFLVVQYGATDQVKIWDGLLTAITSYEFADGTVLSHAQLMQRAPALNVSGTSGNDVITGGGQADTIAGAGGNDALNGGDGNDTLHGDAGGDVLDGNGGADTLNGGEGGDVYRFTRGSGSDLISEIDLSPALTDIDRIEFGPDIPPSGVTATRNANDLLLTITGAADTLRVVDYFARSDNYLKIEEIRFADGTIWTDATIQSKVSQASALDDTIFGTDANNTIDGLAGNDTIDGRDGDDFLFGSAGADTLIGNIGSDTLNGGGDNDNLLGGAGFDSLSGGDGDDFLTGEADNDSLSGGNGADILAGGDGTDYLYGQTGNDRLNGGAGDDYLYGGIGADTYLFQQGSGVDHIVEDPSDSPANVDAVEFAPSLRPEDVSFSRSSNHLLFQIKGRADWLIADNCFQTQDSRNKVEEFRFSDGTIWGLAYIKENLDRVTDGDDYALGYDWDDTIDALAGDDSISGYGGNDHLRGSHGKDQIFGGSGNDTLDGGTEADTIFGNAGDDSVVGGAGDDMLYGDENYLGVIGNDNLHGGAGNDRLSGGQGNDTYLFGRGDGSDRVAEWGGMDRIRLADGVLPANVTLFRHGDDLILSIDVSATQMRIEGHFGASGNSAVESIEFADGTVWNQAAISSNAVVGTANAMSGGAGNNTFTVDHVGDTITEGLNQGIDTVQSSVSYTLGANLENLSLTGYLNIDAIGNDLANTLTGNSSDNYLDGKDGDDLLRGGAGDDTYYIKSGNDVVIENAGEGNDTVIVEAMHFTLPDHVENLKIDGPMGLIYSTQLIGNSLDNVLDGSGGYIYRGNTVMDGGAGADLMIGRTNIADVFYVDNPGDLVQERFVLSEVEGDLVNSSISYTLPGQIENLTLLGNNAISGYGNAKANVLDGSQNDAANALAGGAGDDTYVIGANDIVIEGANQGSDWLEIASGAPSDFSLSDYANVEHLRLRDAVGASNAYGTAENNTIHGNEYANYIAGNGGNDTLIAGFGDDVLDGGAGDDLLTSVESDIWGNRSGQDTYIFGRGYGQDRVQDYDRLGGFDSIRFSPDVSASDVYLARVPSGLDGIDDLAVSILGAPDQITAKYHFSVNAQSGVTEYAIEQMEFADGTVWNSAAIQARVDSNNSNTSTSGSDTIVGSAGDDAINVLTGNDTVSGGDGHDVIEGDSGSDRLFGNEGHDTLRGQDDDDSLSGGTGRDTIEGGAGTDQLFGGDGDDILDGGAGDDRLEGGSGGDAYRLGRGSGSDRVFDATSSGIEADHVLVASDVLPNEVTITRSGDDLLVGIEATADQLRVERFFENSSNGIHRIEEVRFVDGTVWNGAELLELARTIRGTDADDGLWGTSDGDIFYGLTGNDFVEGYEGNDRLDGGAGDDVLSGGLGDDVYVVDSANDVVSEFAGEGIDTVESSVTLTLGSDQENLTLAGVAAINGTGNSLNNELIGNSAANTLNGGAGVDFMRGGAGNDTYVVDNADYVGETAGEGVDLVQSSVSYTLAAAEEIENLTLTGTASVAATGNALSNVLTGNSGANTLTGNEGNDTLNGGAGADTLRGGLGDDSYVVDNTGDVVTENVNEGTDTVHSSLTYTLGANVENLTLSGTSAINANGNALNNVLTGNSASNTLSGGLGDDTYVIGSGDTVTENANAGIDTVQANFTYTLTANVENLVLTGASAINATGNTLNNALTGNSANNTLSGGTGADTMRGGAGNDTYVVENVSDAVIENASEGINLVQSAVTYTLSAEVENLTLTGTSAINATGNGLNNVLTGNSGANVLTGRAGDDTYVVGTGDSVVEAVNEGLDTVQSAITYTLGANVENLTLTGTTAINGTGNSSDNILTGNSANNTLTGSDGNDTLNGGTGTDTMRGGLGDDIYVVERTADVVTENANEGVDTVQSSVTLTAGANVEALVLTGTALINATDNGLNNLLIGNAVNNTLTAAAGNDILQGGAGNDAIRDTSGGNNLFDGGAGADTITGTVGKELFIGGAGNDAITTGTGADLIAFNRGDGQDTIAATTGADNTVSIGGGIRYGDLTLRKSADDLILDVAAAEQITLKDWYASASNKNVLNLQMVAEAMADFDAAGSDPLRDDKIESFNFLGLVDRFDQSGAVSGWALTNALLDFHLSGSDTEALGGDLAYQYGKTGTLAGIGYTAAQNLMASTQFGTGPQALQPMASLQQETIRLA